MTLAVAAHNACNAASRFAIASEDMAYALGQSAKEASAAFDKAWKETYDAYMASFGFKGVQYSAE
jgi:hypothetical protein